MDSSLIEEDGWFCSFPQPSSCINPKDAYTHQRNLNFRNLCPLGIIIQLSLRKTLDSVSHMKYLKIHKAKNIQFCCSFYSPQLKDLLYLHLHMGYVKIISTFSKSLCITLTNFCSAKQPPYQSVLRSNSSKRELECNKFL